MILTGEMVVTQGKRVGNNEFTLKVCWVGRVSSTAKWRCLIETKASGSEAEERGQGSRRVIRTLKHNWTILTRENTTTIVTEGKKLI